MNKNNIQLLVVLFFTVVGIWSCEDYLDIVPKGKKVPKSLDDYAAFLQNPYLTVLGADYFKRYMVNEFYQDPAYIRTNPLNEIHFYWREDLDRIGIYESDGSYTGNYRAIFYMNLIINDVPSISVSTDEERKRARSLVAQAKVCRALHYFHLVNTFAKVYHPETADADNGIPYSATADNFETPFPQVSVGKVYANMLTDLDEAIPYLPDSSANIMDVTKAAGYAMRARINLFMHKWKEAFQDADSALRLKNYLFDYVGYHREYVDPNGDGISLQNDAAALQALPKITYYVGKEENLFVKGGVSPVTSLTTYLLLSLKDSVENQYCTQDSTLFEPGDTRFLCVYYRNEMTGYYELRHYDNKNHGGLRTPEVYLMRAECYARLGQLDKAMDDLNALRQKRILAKHYKPLTASTLKEAIDLIRHERDVELMGTDMRFYDMRRFNTEVEFQRTLVKKDDLGVIHTLKPDSELWVFPFPKAAVKWNPSLKQNTKI